MKIEKNDAPLGAVVTEIELSQRVSDSYMFRIERALADYGVLCFPSQRLEDESHVAFTSRLGPLEVNVASSGFTGDRPEIMVLSNIVKDGKPIGLSDAGQDWHTDMSYSQVPGYATALYALEVPIENDQPLGDTEFSNMYMAYETLADDVKAIVDRGYSVRDFSKFWNHMIDVKKSPRPPLSIEQRKKKPPVIHPLVITHPVSGRKALYADPGFTTGVIGLPKKKSDELLEHLFAHQVKPEFCYRHKWTKGDFLIWDNLASIHRATGGYRADQPRLMRRTQVQLDTQRHSGFGYTDNNVIHI